MRYSNVNGSMMVTESEKINAITESEITYYESRDELRPTHILSFFNDGEGTRPRNLTEN